VCVCVHMTHTSCFGDGVPPTFKITRTLSRNKYAQKSLLEMKEL